MKLARALALLVVLLPGVSRAAVEGEGVHKSLRAVRTDTPPKIDGKLAEPAWQAAPSDDHFTQSFPNEGGPATERTEFRVMYDDDMLYVGVRCYDSHPNDLSVRLTRRDRDIETDWLALYIDSRHDHSSGLVFQLSAAGVMVDGQFFNDNNFNVDWDAVWTGDVSRDSEGWVAEFAIPLSVLRFSNKDVQEWGFQVHRNVSRIREQTMWVYPGKGVQGMVSRFAHVTDIRGLKPRRAFELRPYFVARVRASSDEGAPLLGLANHTEFEPSWDVGADLKLGITSRLTLDATVNPDFGQVEADQVVLNLTRFETFFPEKRPFFLEGRENFETPLTMFYPRRIGRPSTAVGRGDVVYQNSGTELRVTDAQFVTPIWTAAKVTGELVDKVGIGVLGAVTGPEVVETLDPTDNPRDLELSPARFFGVLRGRFDVGRNVGLGVAATAVNRLGGDLYRAAANHDAYAQGIDGWWRSSSGRWRVDGHAVASERIGGSNGRDAVGKPCDYPADEMTAGCQPIARADGTFLEPGAVGTGALARLNYSHPKAFLRAEAKSMSPRLDMNDVGFQPEFNTHYLSVVGGYLHREPGKVMQNWNIIPFFEGGYNWDGTVRQEGLVGLDVEILFKGFYFTSPQLWVRLPGSYDIYETFDGAAFEKPLRLDFNWFVDTNSGKPLYAGLRMFARKNLDDDGYYLGAAGNLRWQVLSNLELSVDPEVGYDQNAVRFYDCSPEGGATSCLVESGTRRYLFADLDSNFISTIFRGTYTLRTTLSLQAYAQLFLASGTFSNFRETTTTGRHPKIEREQLTPLVTTTSDDAFDSAALNVNIVLRWEPDPGTVLFFVYTRDQQAPTVTIRQLDSGPTEEIVLMKLVYFIT